MAGRRKVTKELRVKVEPKATPAPRTAAGCGPYMRRKLTAEFAGIVTGFVESAKTGSCQHVKLVTELLKTPAKRTSRKKGSVSALLEKMERAETVAKARGETQARG